MPTRVLRPDKCGYCHRDIVWGTLQSGWSRSFDAAPKRLAAVAPADRYAYSKRYRAMVCLDGEPWPPEMVLQVHRCREYAEDRLMRNVSGMVDLYEELAEEWGRNA